MCDDCMWDSCVECRFICGYEYDIVEETFSELNYNNVDLALEIKRNR